MSSDDRAWTLIQENYLSDFPLQAGEKILLPWPTLNTALHEILNKSGKEGFLLLHSFKSQINDFNKNNLKWIQDWPDLKFDRVFYVPTRQKIESLHHIALAFERLKEGGDFVLSCANDRGAASFLSRLKELGLPINVLSKNKAKMCVLKMTKTLDLDILQEWKLNAVPQKIADSSYVGVPGIFGWNKMDEGSLLLLESLSSLTGRGADLGSGWGFLSAEAMARFGDISKMDLFEAEARALQCAKINLKSFSSKTAFHWSDVQTETLTEFAGKMDFVLCNPPFHEGAHLDYDLGKMFIQRAAKMLKAGGGLYLVANQFLPYENDIEKHFSKYKRVIQKNGFKVIHAEV